MKFLLFISAVMLMTAFYGCEPVVTFNEPQPAGVTNLSSFPGRLQGHYVSLADSSTLTINDKLIRRIYDVHYKTSLNQLDSNERLNGDTLIDIRTNEKTIVVLDGDSIINHNEYSDTLIMLDDDNVVRKWKGYYFISTRYEGESWEVRKIEQTKGELIISSITARSDIDNLQELTESVQDTVPPYTFSVTKQQFSKFVQRNGFSDHEVFVRLQNKDH